MKISCIAVLACLDDVTSASTHWQAPVIVSCVIILLFALIVAFRCLCKRRVSKENYNCLERLMKREKTQDDEGTCNLSVIKKKQKIDSKFSCSVDLLFLTFQAVEHTTSTCHLIERTTWTKRLLTSNCGPFSQDNATLCWMKTPTFAVAIPQTTEEVKNTFIIKVSDKLQFLSVLRT